MDKNKKTKKKKIKSNRTIISLVLAVLLALLGGSYYIYKQVSAFNNIIYPGVFVEDIDLTAKTKEEARNIIEGKYSKSIVKKNINVTWNNKKFNLSYGKLNPKYNIDETLNKAFNYGKDYNIFSKYKLIKLKNKKNYTLNFTYDKKILISTLKT